MKWGIGSLAHIPNTQQKCTLPSHTSSFEKTKKTQFLFNFLLWEVRMFMYFLNIVVFFKIILRVWTTSALLRRPSCMCSIASFWRSELRSLTCIFQRLKHSLKCYVRLWACSPMKYLWKEATTLFPGTFNYPLLWLQSWLNGVLFKWPKNILLLLVILFH